jgi:hypothetical protein
VRPGHSGSLSCSDLCVSVSVDGYTSPNSSTVIHRSPDRQCLGSQALLQGEARQDELQLGYTAKLRSVYSEQHSMRAPLVYEQSGRTWRIPFEVVWRTSKRAAPYRDAYVTFLPHTHFPPDVTKIAVILLSYYIILRSECGSWTHKFVSVSIDACNANLIQHNKDCYREGFHCHMH